MDPRIVATGLAILAAVALVGAHGVGLTASTFPSSGDVMSFALAVIITVAIPATGAVLVGRRRPVGVAILVTGAVIALPAILSSGHFLTSSRGPGNQTAATPPVPRRTAVDRGCWGRCLGPARRGSVAVEPSGAGSARRARHRDPAAERGDPRVVPRRVVPDRDAREPERVGPGDARAVVGGSSGCWSGRPGCRVGPRRCCCWCCSCRGCMRPSPCR